MEVMMLKTMTKIKLINWHIFDNHTIQINQNTVITGENGHGKSTLMDAVNFVLSGATGKFNQAANVNTKRDIESYVRGKTGFEDKKFIREQHQIVSHIALEFKDWINQKYLTIGVVFEFPFSNNKKHGTFYHISDSQIQEDFYIFNDKVLGLNQFRQAVKANNKTIAIAETKRDMISMIKSTLGLSGKRYFDLLPKALAFQPINEVSQFVYDFLLDEDKVDIETLKMNIESYRQIQKLLEIEKSKLDTLEPLEELSETYREIKSAIEILDYLTVDLEHEAVVKAIENEKSDLMINEVGKEQTLIEKNKIDLDLSTIETSLNELKKSDRSLMIDSYKKQLKSKKECIELIKTTIAKIDNLVNHEVEIAKKLQLDFQVQSFMNASQYNQFTSKIDEYDRILSNKRYELESKIGEHQKELSSLKNTKIELEENIKRLESNRFKYDTNVEMLLNTLKEELPQAFNKKSIEVKPLCELIDIEPENEAWRNAVEGYLNTQRFDIIVEPQYFNKALDIYEKHKFNKKIHGVGIINTNKLRDYTREECSLASKVKGLNEHARQVVSMIMGKVICVSDIGELKTHTQSITATGMTYRNHTARQINQSINMGKTIYRTKSHSKTA